MSKVMIDETIWTYIVQHFQDPTSSYDRDKTTWYDREILREIDRKEEARRKHDSYLEDKARHERLSKYCT